MMMIPAAAQAAFYLAGVMPVFVSGLNQEAWLSVEVKSHGRELLLIDADLDAEQVAAIADQALAVAAERMSRAG